MEAEYHYIYEIYKTGSFSKAAENCFVSQPALSKSVKKVEESIHMPLFDRKKYPLRLTEAGKCYVEMIEKIARAERELKNQINDIQALNSGELRIGGSNYVNASVLTDLLTRFQTKYPLIQISLVENSSKVLIEMLSRLELDITFSCREDLIPDLNHREAFRDHLLMAVPPGFFVNPNLVDCAFTAQEILQGLHLTGKKPAANLYDFVNLPFIALTEGNNLYDRSMKIYQEAGITPTIRIHLEQMTTAYHLAESGFGITLTSDRLIRSPDTDMRFFRLNSPYTERIFYLLLPNVSYTPFAVREFMSMFPL